MISLNRLSKFGNDLIGGGTDFRLGSKENNSFGEVDRKENPLEQKGQKKSPEVVGGLEF